MPLEVTGRLTVLHIDDFDHGKGKYEAFLEDESKKTKFKLHFKNGKMPEGLQSGATVRVRGFAKEQDVYLEADGSTTSMTTLAPATDVVSGDQKTLVMIANFKDAAVACPASTVRDLMFTDPAYKSVDDFYREASFNQVSFSGDVVGAYTINALSTDACNPSAWANAAEAAATAANINVSAYTRKVYVLPSTNSCGYSGLGQVGGSPTRAWTFRCDKADTYAHELGHNMGMNHASTPTNEYADTSDVMGYGGYGLRHVNSAHKEQMGWLPQQVAVVTQSNTYDIAPLETDQSQTQASQVLKIAKPDTGESYYLSYRLPIGFDSGLATTYLRRLNVHRYAGTGGRTYLLQTLADGGSFSDTVNGISVTQISHSDSKVTVQVQIGASCQSGTPSLAITPSSQSGSAGSNLLYNVSLTNTDWSGCPNSTFNLGKSLPAGWSGSVTPSTVTLGPGQSSIATLAVISPSTASGGAYGLAVNASDSANSKHSASASASYTVATSTSCARAAPSLALSPSSQSGKAGNTLNYAVSITNRDSSGCASSTLNLSRSLPSGWSGSVSPTTITLAPGQTSSAALSVTSPTSALSGTYVLSVSTSDSATAGHSTSATGSYLISGDTVAPTAPTGLTASSKGRQVNLAWRAATDNVGVVGYRIWRNGVNIASISGTGTGFTESVPGTGSYAYYVTAQDAAGNISSPSNTATVSVQGKK
jgi:hypothetical protein